MHQLCERITKIKNKNGSPRYLESINALLEQTHPMKEKLFVEEWKFVIEQVYIYMNFVFDIFQMKGFLVFELLPFQLTTVPSLE